VESVDAVTDALRLTAVIYFGLAFEIALLTTTGVLHLARPRHLALAAERHKTAGAIPNWMGAVERPVLVGCVELAVAVGVLLTALRGGVWSMVIAQMAVFALAASLLAFVSVLRRSPSSLPCGCHPFAGEVSGATFVPAGALLVIAGFVAVARGDGAAMATTFESALTMFLLGSLTAGAAIVYAGAATASRNTER
jgi:hypothetical protein